MREMKMRDVPRLEVRRVFLANLDRRGFDHGLLILGSRIDDEKNSPVFLILLLELPVLQFSAVNHRLFVYFPLPECVT